jgi:hypothetical protein
VALGIATPAQRVIAITQAPDHLDAWLLFHIVSFGWAVRIDIGRKDEPLPIRRPSEFGDASRGMGELPRLATVHRHQPDLPRLVVVSSQEGEIASIRGEPREGIVYPLREDLRSAIA